MTYLLKRSWLGYYEYYKVTIDSIILSYMCVQCMCYAGGYSRCRASKTEHYLLFMYQMYRGTALILAVTLHIAIRILMISFSVFCHCHGVKNKCHALVGMSWKSKCYAQKKMLYCAVHRKIAFNRDWFEIQA